MNLDKKAEVGLQAKGHYDNKVSSLLIEYRQHKKRLISEKKSFAIIIQYTLGNINGIFP